MYLRIYILNLCQSLTAENGTKFRFGQNSEGEYGYIINKEGADTVIPFKQDITTISGYLNNKTSPKLIDVNKYGKCTITCSLEKSFVTIKLNENIIDMENIIGYGSGLGFSIATFNVNKGDVVSISDKSTANIAYSVCY